jgi:hypothetical protein
MAVVIRTLTPKHGNWHKVHRTLWSRHDGRECARRGSGHACNASHLLASAVRVRSKRRAAGPLGASEGDVHRQRLGTKSNGGFD